MTSTFTAPIETLRDGALKASIWKNSGENGYYLTATFARTYSKDGQPHDTHSFSGRDLLALAELARRTYNRTVMLRISLNEFDAADASPIKEKE